MKVLWFDTETTGLDPEKHGIIQFACLVEIDGKVKEQFEVKMKPPGTEISEEALKVNGYTRESLESFNSPFYAKRQITDMLSVYVDKYDPSDKFIPAGQNIQFDIDMLHSLFKHTKDNYMFSFINSRGKIDLMAMTSLLQYLGKMPELENQKLVTVANYFGIDTSKAHDAIEDIRMTREVFLKMKGLIK